MNPPIAQPTLLIIDDTPSNLGVVVSLFEDRGYRVVIAQDGEEGVQRAQRVLPDLILLDVMMPGKDGFETCRSLKAQPETQAIPVIFMTALASAEHKVKGFQAGAVDYVTKPLQIDEVLARVETHLKLFAAQRDLAENNGELERRVEVRTAELAAREREFRTLAENQPDNLARYDLQGRTVYMNPRLIAMLGKSLEEMVGKTPLEIRAGPMYEEYQACLLATASTGQPRELELHFSVGDKEAHYHHIRFVAERDGSGEIVGVLTIGRDITARKQMEEALRAERGLFVGGPTVVFKWKAQDGWPVEYVSPNITEQFGYAPEELTSGKISFASLIHPDELARVAAEVADYSARGLVSYEQVYRIAHADGNYRWIYDFTIVVRTGEGVITHYHGYVMDITAQKMAEVDLQQSREQLRGLTAQRERAREEERKYIAREVHDELGQILTGLKLNISVLDHKFAADSPPMREHLKETLMLTDRSLEVARNVAAALRPAALDMGIVSALEWLTGCYGANTGLRCEVRIADDELQLEESHAIALFRIVQESLTNVARYAQADKVLVTLDKEAADYVLTVRDNGVGFDTAAIKNNSFGLVGIRERALMLGGTVTINSGAGSGTEIIVRVPAQIILEKP